MASDRIYTKGGAYTTAGVYPRTNGVMSRALRLVTLQRGTWPAHPDWGVDWASLAMLDEHIEMNAKRAIIAGLKPLLDEGVIRDPVVTIDLVSDWGMGFTLTLTDATTGDARPHSLTAPWVR